MANYIGGEMYRDFTFSVSSLYVFCRFYFFRIIGLPIRFDVYFIRVFPFQSLRDNFRTII